MVSWSFTRCFSANVSAASLFENVATTGPLASPRLTSNLAPSWVTTYVLMPSVWHGPSHAPSGTVYESFSPSKLTHYVGDSSRRPHPSPDSPGAVPLRTSRHRGHDDAGEQSWGTSGSAIGRGLSLRPGDATGSIDTRLPCAASSRGTGGDDGNASQRYACMSNSTQQAASRSGQFVRSQRHSRKMNMDWCRSLLIYCALSDRGFI